MINPGRNPCILLKHMFHCSEIEETFQTRNSTRTRGRYELQGSASIEARIAKRFDRLSPQLRRAASFVLAHPDEVASRSLRQISRTAEVAPPTLSRLARALECESYEELREICRQDIKRRRISLSEKARILQNLGGDAGADDRQPFILRQTDAVLNGLQSLVQDIDISDLRAAADELAAARQVLLIGSMSATYSMHYMGFMAAMAFDNWRLVETQPGRAAAGSLLGLSEADAVIVISHAPYARRSVQLAELCQEAGAYVLAITDHISSPLLKVASAHFLVSTDSPQFFPSNVATLCLIESLMGMLIRRGGAAVGDRIAAAEAANTSLGEYW